MRAGLVAPLLGATLAVGLGGAAHADSSQLLGLQQRDAAGSPQLGILSRSEHGGREQSQLLGAQQTDRSGDQQQAGVASRQVDGRGRSQSQLVGAQQTQGSGDQQQLGVGQRQRTPAGNQQQLGVLGQQSTGRGDQQQAGLLQRQREGRPHAGLRVSAGGTTVEVAR